MKNSAGSAIVLILVGGGMVLSTLANPGIPFEPHRGYAVVVRAQIGSLDKVKVLIDTGATVTVIDSRLAKKLELSPTPVDALQLFGSRQAVEETRISRLIIGEFTRQEVAALVADLSPLGGVEAIVGVDFLGRTRLTIDYQKKRAYLGSHEALPAVCPLDSAAPVPAVEVQVQGKTLRLWLDTGAQESVLFQDRVEKKDLKLGLRAVRGVAHIAGQNPARRVELSRFVLGSQTWRGVPALVVHRSEAPELEIDGLLSIASLKMRRIQLDLPAGEFRWE